MAENITANEPVLLGDDSGLTTPGTTLVLGMTWKVILGKDLQATALQMATKAKANFYTHAKNIGNVGYTSIKTAKKTAYVSAAAIVAQQHPVGNFLIALEVNTTETWLCGVSNGSVLSGYDIVCSNDEGLDSLIADYKERFDDAKLHGDIENGFEAEYSWTQLSEGLTNNQFRKQAQVRKTTKPLAERLGTVPKKYIYIGGALLILIFGQRFVLPTINKLMDKSNQKATIDPVAAWQDAVDSWVNSHPVSGVDELNTLLNTLGDQPMVIAGWRQTATDCVWGPKSWTCTSKYTAKKRSQTNQAFINEMPKGWEAAFQLYSDVVVKYSIPTTSKPLSIKALRTASDYELITGSELQQITPLLPNTTSPLSKFTAVVVDTPKTPEGVAITLPAEVTLPKIATLALSGPMRNIVAIQGWVNEVAWTNVAVKIDLEKTQNAKSSTVTMDLKGNLYAKK